VERGTRMRADFKNRNGEPVWREGRRSAGASARSDAGREIARFSKAKREEDQTSLPSRALAGCSAKGEAEKIGGPQSERNHR